MRRKQDPGAATFSNAVSSATFNSVKILPAPQVMISMPWSLPASNPANTESMAVCRLQSRFVASGFAR